MTYLQLFFPALLVLCAVAMLWHGRTQSIRSRRFFWLAFIALVLFCWPPFAWLLSSTLEWRYVAPPLPEEEAAAIVVLGGAEMQTDGVSPVWIPGWDTYVRCRHAAWLHRKRPDLPVIVCGGEGRAETMRDLLADEGVPKSSIVEEARSTSTYENAVFAAELLEERKVRRVFLVTEAHHMLRAELCFEGQGLEVVPAPCAFRTETFAVSVASLLPGATAIRHNEESLHEWIGLAWYWLKGRIRP